MQDPLTGSLFYIESTDEDQQLRPYSYDETGVVLKGWSHLSWPSLGRLEPTTKMLIDQGTLILEDETGQTATLTKGDTFFIHRGSKMRFTTPDFGIAFKGASRWKNVSKL